MLISLFLSGFILFYVAGQRAENVFLKCCAEDGRMVSENFLYMCNLNRFNNTNETALSKISESFCVDTFGGDFYAFEKTSLNLFRKLFALSRKLDPKLNRKCCPLGFVYNTVYHSCEENLLYAKNLARYVRIGLPDCKIIQDIKSHTSTSNLGNISVEDYCTDRTEDGTELVRICTSDFQICKFAQCVHKCCPDGFSFVNGSHCHPTFIHGLDLNFSESIQRNDDVAIVHGYMGQIYLQPMEWTYHLDFKGVFHGVDEIIGNQIYEATEQTYCIEFAMKDGVNFGHRLFRIFPETEIEEKYVINGYVMIISSIFLLLTIIFYVCSGETKKLFGKTLVSFCVCLFVMFLILIYSTFYMEKVKEDITVCHIFGFLLLYGEFATFLWLKLLCFDIYYAFGSGKMRSEPKRNGLKRFMIYSAYGWGLSLLLTIIPLTLSFMDVLPDPFAINMGISRCAIERDQSYADLVFRTIPVAVIQLVNLFLFYKTVKYCIQIKNEIKRMNETNNQSKKFLINKERFILVAKLSVIMGISYVFEVASSFCDFSQTEPTKYLEIVWDIINCLQGVFIFIIFVCKRKILEKFASHIRILKLRKISISSGATLTTNLSLDKDKNVKLGA
ncbi:hypothetical protein HUJ04_003188 [Dendroctonus ponderosae]|nr:hypothetical protein HUJ04_003188 [Dendroctonus ponderosae]KAH1014341.1 hypothetical protein HUJ04_003188 [Dendroctonus ponderosae]